MRLGAGAAVGESGLGPALLEHKNYCKLEKAGRGDGQRCTPLPGTSHPVFLGFFSSFLDYGSATLPGPSPSLDPKCSSPNSLA